MKLVKIFILFLVNCYPFTILCAAPNTNGMHMSQASKVGQYIAEGFFLGGSKDVKSARLKDIRRGPQKGENGRGERVVFDLETTAQSPQQVPYFQLNVNPKEGRLLLSIWTDIMYEFDRDRVLKAFAKSENVKEIRVVPRLEDGVGTIEITLKDPKKTKVEAFYLGGPSRIILDFI